jgi:uncharacterized protein YukE
MSTQSDRDAVDVIKHQLEGLAGTHQAGALTEALLKIQPPAGNADGVAELAGQFKSSANNLTEIQLDVYKVIDNVPDAWVGVAANRAGDVMLSIYTQAGRSVQDLTSAQGVLNKLADAFGDARTAYDNAQDPLHSARSAAALGAFEQVRARDLAIAGAEQLLHAFDTVLNASRDAARDLRALAADARASQLSSGSLTSADKLVLASVSDNDRVNPNWILTQAQAERAAQQLDALTPEDRQRFDGLLAAAKTPQERAYLMKALATGSGMAVVGAFADRIHFHGDDPDWLRNHLSAAQIPQATPGHGTEAMAIIQGRAAIDPVYASYLIDGADPNDPNGSSVTAVNDRLEAEQHRVGSEPDHTLARTWEVGDYSGTTYQHHDVGPGERAAMLDQVEQAADRGQTVFVHTSDGHEGMVVGHQGDTLEVRDMTSGTTTRISERDFVDGLLPGASKDINSVDLPT